MTKKVIAVDMDDTICHLVKRAIYHNNLNYPTHLLRYEDMNNWNTDHLRHPECTQEVFFGRPGLYEELEIFDDHVISEMEKIHNQYDLIIVTAAWPKAITEKWNWLQKYMPFIPYDNFCSWKRKYMIEFDLLIDDGSHNLEPALNRGKKVICIPQPWNQSFRTSREMPVKEDGWKGMTEFVDQVLEV